ncbi:hypothetical protein [Lactobacillus delbrueckii]
MKRQWKFIVVLVLGAIGLITDNVLHIPGIAEVLFDIAGVYVSISLAREMFGDLNANFPGFYNSMSKKPTITAFFEV